MFDRGDPADLLSLQTEVTTDPIAMGYDASGPTQPLLKLLNDAALNVGGDTAGRLFDVESMMDAYDPQDLDAQQAPPGLANYVHTLVEVFGSGIEIAQYKAQFRALFALIPNSTTVSALDAQTVALSRAEVLFGQGTVISREDWTAARDS